MPVGLSWMLVRQPRFSTGHSRKPARSVAVVCVLFGVGAGEEELQHALVKACMGVFVVLVTLHYILLVTAIPGVLNQ